MLALIPAHEDFERLNNLERKKHAQKLRIIKQLYVKGPKSNADLCTSLKMSTPTAIGLLNELSEEQWIEKKGQGKSIGGRKPDLFRLKEHALYVLSIHIDKFRTKMVIMDSHHHPIGPVHTFPIEISRDLSAVAPLIEHASALIEASGIAQEKLIGIGISMPGLVSTKEGKNHTYFKTAKETQSIQQLLESKLHKPVYIQNDAKCAALAERYFGQAKGKKDVLVLSIDLGIGLGVIMDGKLRTGTTGFSGEFGHIPLVDDGMLCHCGKRGCLETVASGMAVARRAMEGIQSGEHTMLNTSPEQEIQQIGLQEVIAAANHGDQFAINILSKTGVNLGKGIAILIQLYNPEMAIIGGEMAEAKQYITVPIQQAINSYCMTQLREKTAIVLSTLGEKAGIMGAVATVMENVFEPYI